VPIGVLVNCGTAKKDRRARGRAIRMEARNIAHDGVGLRWSRRLAMSLCPKCDHFPSDKACENKNCLCGQKMADIRVGQEVNLDDLIYTEKGSEPIMGKVCWIKISRRKDACDVGVRVTSANHRTHFKALEDKP
jgi:hypothetical protein